jgi:integrase
MRPFNEDELTEVVARIRRLSPVLAEVTLIAGWTGLRWGELRALRVADIQEIPRQRSACRVRRPRVARSRSPRVVRLGVCRWRMP